MYRGGVGEGDGNVGQMLSPLIVFAATMTLQTEGGQQRHDTYRVAMVASHAVQNDLFLLPPV